MVGAGNSYPVNTIGGLSVNTLTVNNLPSHSHSYNEPINHSHGLSSGYACISLWGDQNIYRAKAGSWVTTWHNGYNVGMQGRSYTYSATSGTELGGSTDNGGASQNASTGSTGSGVAFSNVPPYKAVYIWERTK